MKKTFLIIGLILSAQAHAQKQNSCNNLAASTCSSLGASDGTTVGTVKDSPSSFTEKLKKDTFPSVQKAIVKKVSSLPLDESTRTAIIAKINGMKFSTSCEDLSASLDPALWPNSFFSPTENTFYLCKAKPGMSEFAAAKMISEELSATINPCGIDSIIRRPKERTLEQSETAYPIKGVISCLRSEKSVGAKRNNSSSFQDVGFCMNDQITRSFTDWMTTEVVTDYISQKYKDLTQSQWRQGIANSYRDECSVGRPDDGFTEDPEFEVRINGIVGANPALRKKIGCYDSSQYLYCDASNPDAMAKAVGAPKAAPSGLPNSGPADSKGAVQ
ncbi:hypothetical protein ACLVWU_03145 [Bdellovibrio sp. HCB290]|uniref:hypothetical protein n=1 Tax=Bdellovibrio sp. HCB290 TaxID=3394356 RepID=UPI0039B50B3E